VQLAIANSDLQASTPRSSSRPVVKSLRTLVRRTRWVWLPLAIGLSAAAVLWLRHSSFAADPLFISYLELAGCLLTFTYAANALVRFRGNHDRVSLILAIGFVLTGLIEMGGIFGFHDVLEAPPGAPVHLQITWSVSRTLLAVVLLAALVVERRMPNSRDPHREITGAFLLVGFVAYLVSAFYLGWPGEPQLHPGTFLARPWDLLPAALFLAAAIGLRARHPHANSAFDRTLFGMAWLNFAAQLVITQSERMLDAPFTLAQVLKVSSYALVLGGALLDNARLFDQVRHMAVSDPLTGLANYRRLLFDLDGLKSINDRYGHLVGSRAICRLAEVLRVNCRTLDTAARYGGDEFAVVLPEARAESAAQVAQRICDRLAGDGEAPRLTVSFGAAVYPQDGDSAEKLFMAADRDLYKMKGRTSSLASFARIASCL
jgi:diguanylate cyclase (GGDEF)-like protein